MSACMSSSSVPEVGQEGERLGRRARLRGDQVERLCRVEMRRWLRRTAPGSVESSTRSGDAAGAARQRAGEDLRGERRAAHAAHQRGTEALVAHSLGECGQLLDPVAELRRQRQPAEAVGDQRPRRAQSAVQSEVSRVPEPGDPVALDGARLDARPARSSGRRSAGMRTIVSRECASIECRSSLPRLTIAARRCRPRPAPPRGVAESGMWRTASSLPATADASLRPAR